MILLYGYCCRLYSARLRLAAVSLFAYYTLVPLCLCMFLAPPVHIHLRRHAEWFPVEQTRTARKAGPNRAAFGRTVTSAAKGRTIYQHRHYKPTFLALLRYSGFHLEGGSVNRCFQVVKVSRKARCGKIGRRRRPISTARGNM